jgi:hypothetical protein
MTVRMKTKQADYNIEFIDCPFARKQVERVVYIWHDSRAEEYLVSNTAQNLLGYSSHHTRVHVGPYSKWQLAD